MKALRFILAAALLIGLAAPASFAAESSGTTWINAPNDLRFNRGGVAGRYLIFNDWVSQRNYTLNSVIKHSGALWVALADPAAGDEPGVHSSWEKITDQPTGSGSVTFIGDTDTPSTYTGHGGQVTRVNTAEDALEFFNFAGAVSAIVGAEVQRNPSGVGDPSDVLQSFSVGVGTPTLYDVAFLRPAPSDGRLRAAQLPDFTLQRVAYDGTSLYRAGRRLIPAHSASATFTARGDLWTVSVPGDAFLWRFRTFHHHDSQVSDARDQDFYINLVSQRLRIRFGGNWHDAPPNHRLLNVLQYRGFFEDETHALANVTADGQNVAYAVTGSDTFATVSDFVAGDPAHYIYEWVQITPAYLPPPSTAEVGRATIANDFAEDTWSSHDMTQGIDEMRAAGAQYLGITLIGVQLTVYHEVPLRILDGLVEIDASTTDGWATNTVYGFATERIVASANDVTNHHEARVAVAVDDNDTVLLVSDDNQDMLRGTTVVLEAVY